MDFKRKELVKNAKKNLKKHYWLLVAVCLFAAFIGSEYTETMEAFKSLGTVNNEIQGAASVEANVDTVANSSVVSSVVQAMGAVITGDEDFGRTQSDAKVSEAKDNATKVLGRTRGVFASLVNGITSGGIVFTFVDSLSSVISSRRAVVLILLIAALMVYVFITFFIKKTYLVISRRIVLETRTYDAVPPGKFMFLLRVKRWMKASWVLIVNNVYEILWSLTIVGIFVKHFSYMLVPYIIAENPDMKANEAITLSRKMMKGYKWRAFLYGLSFIGWTVIGMATLGVVGVLFVNPYKAAFYAEFYANVRAVYLEKEPEAVKWLNDSYLYERPSEEQLRNVYADVFKLIDSPQPQIDFDDYHNSRIRRLKKLRVFLANTFGIILINSQAELEFEEKKKEMLRMSKNKAEAVGKAYPARLFNLKEHRVDLENTVYMRNYSIPSLILIFFSLCFVGWIWEVTLHLISSHTFVNRGVLHGPWLPIYGSGGILILICLKKLRNKPVVEFFASVVLCGFVEYFTSLYLEISCGRRWWNYNGYFLNLNGRICAEGLLVFGLGGVAIVYIIAPLLDNFFRKIKLRVVGAVCAALIAAFVVDMVYSKKNPNTGKGISTFNDNTPEYMLAEMYQGAEDRYEDRISFNQKF